MSSKKQKPTSQYFKKNASSKHDRAKKEESKHNSTTQQHKGVEQEDFIETLKRIGTSKITHMIGIFFVLFVLMSVAYDVRTGAVDYESSWTCEVKKVFDDSTVCSLRDSIQQSIYQQIQQLIQQQLQQQYPNAQNEQFIQQELANRFNEVLETNTFQGQDLDQIVELQYQNYKDSFQSDSGQTYFTGIDPYFYLGISSNYYQNGHPGTTLDENGTSIIEYQLAPQGKTRSNIDMHSYVMSQMYNLNNLDPQSATAVEKMEATYTLPAILAMLTIIPLFFLLRSTTNTSFAIIGSLALTTLGIYLSRTQGGFVDTDGYIIFFAVLITTSLYYAFKSQALWMKLSLSGISGVFTILFQWAWGNSWFFIIFAFVGILTVIGFEILFVLKDYLRSKKNNKTINNFFKEVSTISYISKNIPGLFIGGVYFITVELLNLITRQREILTLLYEQFYSSVSNLTTSTTGNIWPNVLSSVAELQSTNVERIFSQLINQVSTELTMFITLLSLLGIFSYINSKFDYKTLFPQYHPLFTQWSFNIIYVVILFLLLFQFQQLSVNSAMLYSILLILPIFILLGVYAITRNDSYSNIQHHELFFISLLLIWFAGGIFMSLNGVRFILLLGPAFIFVIVYGLYKIIEQAVELLRLEFKNMNALKAQTIMSVFVLFISLLMLSGQINQAYAQTSSNTPNFDDSWFELMDYVQENTSEDTIINSWWDFGHFFAAIGNRGVTFDGASQGTPASYWTGNWLLTSDETRAVNILQMLSCSLNQGFEYADSIIDDNSQGVKSFHLIDELMNLEDEEEMREYLENYEEHNFTQDEIDKLLSLIHCEEPRPMSLITSEDMVQKAGVWGHWGSWNATQKYILDNYNKISIEEMSENLSLDASTVEESVNELEAIDSRARNFDVSKNDLQNQWLAPYPSYLSQPIECQIENDIVNCQNQLQINLSDQDNITTQGQITSDFDVSRIIIPSTNDLSTFEINDKQELDVLVIPDENTAQILISQYPLGTSMFTRLFYLDGFGTSQFEELTRVNTQTTGRVILWNTIFEDEDNLTPQVSIGDVSVETGQNAGGTEQDIETVEAPEQEVVLDEIVE
ncbi:MAG: STT3 domain-containing protein [Candidatus Nanoarchaeia archaeon]